MGSILGSPYFGKLPHEVLGFRVALNLNLSSVVLKGDVGRNVGTVRGVFVIATPPPPRKHSKLRIPGRRRRLPKIRGYYRGYIGVILG